MENAKREYYDNPNRVHNYNERSFYNKIWIEFIDFLESKWFKKTEKFIDVFWIYNFYYKTDYYKIIEKEDVIELYTYELQQMNKYEWLIVVKEHKYINLMNTKTFNKTYNNKKVIWYGCIANITKEWIEFLNPDNYEFSNQIELSDYLEIFRRWNEKKSWRFARLKQITQNN